MGMVWCISEPDIQLGVSRQKYRYVTRAQLRGSDKAGVHSSFTKRCSKQDLQMSGDVDQRLTKKNSLKPPTSRSDSQINQLIEETYFPAPLGPRRMILAR